MLSVLVMHVSVLLIMECLVICMLGIGLVLSGFAMSSHGGSVLVVLMALFVMLWVALLLIHDSLIVVCLVVALTVAVLVVPTFNVFVLGVSAVGVLVCVAHSLKIVLRVVLRWVPSFSVFVVADQRSIVFVNINILVVSNRCMMRSDDSCVVWGNDSFVVSSNNLVMRSDDSLVMHRFGIVVNCFSLVMNRRGLSVVMLW